MSDFKTMTIGAALINVKDTTARQLAAEIQAKIPVQATSINQLADKAFVNSSVQTATANFRGNWETWDDVPTNEADYPEGYGGSTIPTINDYIVVQDSSDYGADYEGTWRFKYTGSWSQQGKSGWEPEYQVNEQPLTASQIAALNSSITAEKVAEIGTKQGQLVSGMNIKTINGTSVLGAGNLNTALSEVKIEDTGSAQTITLQPNILYYIGSIAPIINAVTLTLGSTIVGKMNEYHFIMKTGAIAPSVTFPSGISWNGGSEPTIAANKTYEVSILNNIGLFIEI